MQSTPKRRGEQYTYYQVAEFKGDDATAQLQRWKENMDSPWNEDGNKWNSKRKSQSEKHDVENFECSYSRRKNYSYLAVLRIRRIGGKQEIVVERAKSHSDHKPISGSARSFSSPVKKFVSERMQDKTPKKIQNDISMNRKALNLISAPLLKQIENFVYRSKESNVPLSSLDLEKYYEANSTVPEKVAGFSDANKKFYLTHIALVSNENEDCYQYFFRVIAGLRYNPGIVMADGDRAITSAAVNVWPMSLRLMCWFHAMKNIRKRAKDIKLDKHTRIWIYKQLSFLQCAASTQEFVKAACSLQESLDHLSREKPLVILLSKYIFENWINSDYCNWYEEASDNVSTNNSLESRNRVTKACEVIGKNLPLQKFMSQMKLMVENCSSSPDHQNPAKAPSIAPDVYRQAYLLEKEGRSMIQLGSAYLLPSKSGLEKNLLEVFEALHSLPSCMSWEIYKENRSALHILNHSKHLPSGDKEVTVQALYHAYEELGNSRLPERRDS